MTVVATVTSAAVIVVAASTVILGYIDIFHNYTFTNRFYGCW